LNRKRLGKPKKSPDERRQIFVSCRKHNSYTSSSDAFRGAFAGCCGDYRVIQQNSGGKPSVGGFLARDGRRRPVTHFPTSAIGGLVPRSEDENRGVPSQSPYEPMTRPNPFVACACRFSSFARGT
jgi:hypothetical protein